MPQHVRPQALSQAAAQSLVKLSPVGALMSLSDAIAQSEVETAHRLIQAGALDLLDIEIKAGAEKETPATSIEASNVALISALSDHQPADSMTGIYKDCIQALVKIPHSQANSRVERLVEKATRNRNDKTARMTIRLALEGPSGVQLPETWRTGFKNRFAQVALQYDEVNYLDDIFQDQLDPPQTIIHAKDMSGLIKNQNIPFIEKLIRLGWRNDGAFDQVQDAVLKEQAAKVFDLLIELDEEGLFSAENHLKIRGNYVPTLPLAKSNWPEYLQESLRGESLLAREVRSLARLIEVIDPDTEVALDNIAGAGGLTAINDHEAFVRNYLLKPGNCVQAQIIGSFITTAIKHDSEKCLEVLSRHGIDFSRVSFWKNLESSMVIAANTPLLLAIGVNSERALRFILSQCMTRAQQNEGYASRLESSLAQAIQSMTDVMKANPIGRLLPAALGKARLIISTRQNPVPKSRTAAPS